jgi:hypothetical protein
MDAAECQHLSLTAYARAKCDVDRRRGNGAIQEKTVLAIIARLPQLSSEEAGDPIDQNAFRYKDPLFDAFAIGHRCAGRFACEYKIAIAALFERLLRHLNSRNLRATGPDIPAPHGENEAP